MIEKRYFCDVCKVRVPGEDVREEGTKGLSDKGAEGVENAETHEAEDGEDEFRL